MLFDQNMIIDATRGSIARFVNHSCAPNCKMEKWTVNGKPRMALFAGDRDIMTGEELTYDYNFDNYSQKNVQECRCGAEICRGILGKRSKDDKKRNSPEEEANGSKSKSKLAGAKRKIAEAIEGTTTRVSKKVKIATVPKSTVIRKSISPVKARSATTLIKKVASRKTSATVVKGLSRRPSKLAMLKDAAKRKAVKSRVVSTSSSKALIASTSPRKSTGARPMSRSSSLKEKANSVKSRVVRTVRGARSGQRRSIRAVEEEGGIEVEDMEDVQMSE
jgi:[histone H3]-lysine4 N-trimethyltransferase ASH1L